MTIPRDNPADTILFGNRCTYSPAELLTYLRASSTTPARRKGFRGGGHVNKSLTAVPTYLPSGRSAPASPHPPQGHGDLPRTDHSLLADHAFLHPLRPTGQVSFSAFCPLILALFSCQFTLKFFQGREQADDGLLQTRQSTIHNGPYRFQIYPGE